MILRKLLISLRMIDYNEDLKTYSIHLNIIMTYKTLRDEGHKVFYHKNIFRVSLYYFSKLRLQIPLLELNNGRI